MDFGSGVRRDGLMVTPAEFVGATGVAMLLLAFLLLQINRLEKAGWIYLSLNTAGAALACLSSYMIGFWPFVILEGVWAVSSGIALARFASRPAILKGGY